MSIMPEGGWGDPPRQESQQTPSYPQQPAYPPQQPTYTPRSYYLTCKVCDRGTLSSKTVFRMSGPVVAIGFILLIPSILGMLSCAVMLLAFNTTLGATLGINANGSRRLHQSAADAEFRKECKEAFLQESSELPGVSAPQFCECALSATKAIGPTGSWEGAYQTCAQRGLDHTLEQPSQDVYALYSSDISNPTNAGLITAAGVFGNAFFIGLGIACFVSGLLGWLLVMKKRVLQCDVCSAVVNAS